MERRRTSDLSREDAVPYFLWDEDTSVAELRRVLREGPESLRIHYVAKILREARPEHAWLFFRPEDVRARWTEVRPRLGRMTAVWEFLFDQWARDGLLA
ncbi:MAG: hypothetical protein HYY17_00690 [Planctomycetes bacterium]|nr:hypothetical protein [Planctomycetota bacterium]